MLRLISSARSQVLRNREVTPEAHQVFIDVGSLAAEYTKPGMFIQVSVDKDLQEGVIARAEVLEPEMMSTLTYVLAAVAARRAQQNAQSTYISFQDSCPPSACSSKHQKLGGIMFSLLC